MHRKLFKLHRKLNKLPHKWWLNKLPKKHFSKDTIILVLINIMALYFLALLNPWNDNILVFMIYINMAIVILRQFYK